MSKNLLTFSVRKLFSTINKKEMEQFDKIKSWWHPSSEMSVLYQYNYERIDFLREILKKEKGDKVDLLKPVNGWKVIDVGCGAGFLA
jgi:2-polyprenyl-3-methyl-5-hydroxy-6-metoxy-1,4-benzoquinol methylase